MCAAIRSGQAVDHSPADVEERKEWLGDWQPESFNFHVARRAFDV
jgi:hypothetical protein